ncbi:S-adenosyl-L-homocysteine hydrolase [Melampsora larici-populina 98AG31]|uniref:S-adenosyl-L-homocysteine hydrolase n=1 Tax=Melampsora larici-populina (strain 98AG31 / pathotype 3-4-7) TaxID=747676 RepID=F4R316_MELLP|nr:S-adenosyl-L-homocysteine hydrolase [Melampsora larici-populina 98AG31]EGG13248.1 S-adenosyl-L-homocysteine hydrolase [Melampsora larici-populina 98AG31]
MATKIVIGGKATYVGTHAFSRATDALEKIDLRDTTVIEDLIKNFKPILLVHCAAERRPDVAEKDPEGLSNGIHFVSSIYAQIMIVFDGNAPEGGYDINDEPNPTNLYGETKLAGEKATFESGEKGQVLSLRAPVLYGKAGRNDEAD